MGMTVWLLHLTMQCTSTMAAHEPLHGLLHDHRSTPTPFLFRPCPPKGPRYRVVVTGSLEVLPFNRDFGNTPLLLCELLFGVHLQRIVWDNTPHQNPPNINIHSLRVGWRNLVRVSLIFAIIVSFMLFTVFPLVMYFISKNF